MMIDDAKAYLRIDDDAEDPLIARLIAAATGMCERFTGQTLVIRSMTEAIAANGSWCRLRTTPVRTITSVQGLPAAGMPFALAMDAYAIDIDASGDGWVRVIRPSGATRALVTVEAGIAADADTLPAPLYQGVLRLVVHLHAHRDAADDDGPPAAVAALWRPWRRMRLR
jgi:uncharacterized phiE125 gp8 family phage protein